MSDYLTETRWREYLRFLPDGLAARCDEIREERWDFRGMRVHLDRLVVPEAPVKMLLVHGAGAYGRIMMLLAVRLGVELVAPDLPGYGLSDPRGRSVDYGDWVECVAALAAREKDGRPLVVFGGSMGGLIAYSAAARGGVDGLIATCFLDPRRAEVRRHIARTPRLAPLLRFAPRRMRVPIRWLAPIDKMSNAPALSTLCARDPLGGGGRVSIGWLRTFLEAQPSDPRDFRACPVLLAHPGADAWTPLAISRPFFDALPGEKELVELGNAGHFPIEEPGLSQLESSVRAFLAKLTK